MLSDLSPAESLRKAIENLINVKLHDALAKPGGLDRLVAHRSMGVASFAVRQAERQLEEALTELLPMRAWPARTLDALYPRRPGCAVLTASRSASLSTHHALFVKQSKPRRV